ncbi:hypothetical protein YC2023_033079 [Brassica napus]
MGGDTCCTHVVRDVSHTCKRKPLTSIWLAAWLEGMHRDSPHATCRSTCFGYMRGDTSCLIDPPRASTCQAACPSFMQGEILHYNLGGNISRASGFSEKYYKIPKLGFLPNFGFSRRACFPKLCDEETSVFKNVELLNHRASKNMMLQKRQSDQYKTFSNMFQQLIRLMAHS